LKPVKKVLFRIFIFLILLQFGNTGHSQYVYFNKRYYLNEPDIWSSAKDIIEIEDGYVVVGATGDSLNYYWNRIGVMKMDFQGNQLWARSFGDTIATYFSGYPGSLCRNNSNCFFIAGAKQYYNPNTYNVGLLLKLNNYWDIIWIKEYSWDYISPPDTSIHFNQMKICENNDLVFCGTFNDDNIGCKFLLLRTDSLGNTKWLKTYGYGGTTLNNAYSVIQTTDSGFAIGGYKYTPGQPESGNPIVIKTDSLGNQQWMKNLGGPYVDYIARVCNSMEGNILVGTCYSDSMFSNDEAYSRINIVNIDNQGNVLWNKKYGASRHHNYLLNIITLHDGSIVATGSIATESPDFSGWILKVTGEGDSLWYREYIYLSGSGSSNYLSDVIETSDNGFLVCGKVFPMRPDTGIQDAWVIKLDSMGYDTPGCAPVQVKPVEFAGKEGLKIYPNPSSSVINFEFVAANKRKGSFIEIFDLFGRKIKEMEVPAGENKVILNIESWRKGLYLARVRYGEDRIKNVKIVVQ